MQNASHHEPDCGLHVQRYYTRIEDVSVVNIKTGWTLPATSHYPRPTTTHNVNVRISGIEAAALPKLDRYPATDRIPELCIWNSCFSCKYKYIYQIEIEIPIQLYA